MPHGGHGHHGGGGHHGHGGHIPQSAFLNWGGWGWSEPSVYVVEGQDAIPDWVWIAGGALAGVLLAVLTRGR